MADVAAATPAVATPKKAAKAKSGGKPKPKMNHPKTSDMVMNAIKNLKERGGSSVQAIKKYISANYKVDVEKLSPFIKKYLKSAVTSGALVQTKGKGATGSFKVVAKKEPKKVKASTTSVAKPKAKPAGEKKATTATAKKSVKKIKKAASPKKPAAAKSKAPKKEKKAKTPKKPKAPKPKKAVAKPKAKKAAPKKK